MKMVKSLLLGSAAGLVAVAGAQAADLPVKAAPVQYVKICSLYGVGFYYIPGTDMCLKIGGWVRAEGAWNVNGNSTQGVPLGDVNNRSTQNYWTRVRGYITADARSQTEYGTLRSYIALGISTNTAFDGPQTFNANRAFIQWAGFTFGRAQSFFDFYSQAAVGYLGFTPNSDTGDGGWDIFGYTAQFGNGFSASISAEARRTTEIVGQGCQRLGAVGTNCDASPTAPNVGSINGLAIFQPVNNAPGYGGWQMPDIVGNLRVDQAWGSAQIGGAVHQVNPVYYNSTNSVPTGTGNLFLGQELSGNPSSEYGWAAMAGLRLNAPFIGAGDYLAVQGIYTQGAVRYIFQNPNGNWWLQDGGSAAYGVLADGVYGGSALNGTGTSVELTTAWGLNAGYEHFWSPRWRTSLYGGYTNVEYNNQANAMLCVLQGDGNGRTGTLALANVGCDNNWTSWWIGSRTQWNVTKDFYLGVDVAYLKFQGMTSSNGLVNNNTAIIPGTTNTAVTRFLDDQDTFMFRFRVHRDFYP